MDRKIEEKTVRDARGEARRAARCGGGTYQQCLDAVATARGHRHWKDFMSAHAATDGPDSDVGIETVEEVRKHGKRFYEPIPYEEWKKGLPARTRTDRDEARVEKIARRADRLAERTGLPLWFVGCAPIMSVCVIMAGFDMISGPSMDGIMFGLFRIVQFAGLCLILYGFGQDRTISGFRSAIDTLATTLQVGLAMYLMIYMTVMMSGDAKVQHWAERYHGSPGRTIAMVTGLAVAIHLFTLMTRWTIVIASRHPSLAGAAMEARMRRA